MEDLSLMKRYHFWIWWNHTVFFSVVDEILHWKKEYVLPLDILFKDVIDQFGVFFHTKTTTIWENLDA